MSVPLRVETPGRSPETRDIYRCPAAVVETSGPCTPVRITVLESWKVAQILCWWWKRLCSRPVTSRDLESQTESAIVYCTRRDQVSIYASTCLNSTLYTPKILVPKLREQPGCFSKLTSARGVALETPCSKPPASRRLSWKPSDATSASTLGDRTGTGRVVLSGMCTYRICSMVTVKQTEHEDKLAHKKSKDSNVEAPMLVC